MLEGERDQRGEQQRSRRGRAVGAETRAAGKRGRAVADARAAAWLLPSPACSRSSAPSSTGTGRTAALILKFSARGASATSPSVRCWWASRRRTETPSASTRFWGAGKAPCARRGPARGAGFLGGSTLRASGIDLDIVYEVHLSYRRVRHAQPAFESMLVACVQHVHFADSHVDSRRGVLAGDELGVQHPP